MWLRIILLLQSPLLLTDAERLVKRDQELTDEAAQAQKVADAAEKLGEVTDALFGKDSPFKKLSELSKTLSNIAGPVGIGFGVASALISLLGPKEPDKFEILAKKLDGDFDKVHQKLDHLKYEIQTISRSHKIDLQMFKLDNTEERELLPLYNAYDMLRITKASKDSVKEFRHQCGLHSPYNTVAALAKAFAIGGKTGSTSLFDERIRARDPKNLVEGIRDRLLVDFTQAIIMIPLCGSVRGQGKQYITAVMERSNMKMKGSMEEVNTKIHNAFHRDTYDLQFCLTNAIPYNPNNWELLFGIEIKMTESKCMDSPFNYVCEFRFKIQGQQDIPGKGWRNFGRPESVVISEVRTDGGKVFNRPLCLMKNWITYEKDKDLYQTIWNGGPKIRYEVFVDEMDDSTPTDVVMKPGLSTDPTSKFPIPMDHSRSSQLGRTGAGGRVDQFGPGTKKWKCEDETMCQTIQFFWEMKRIIRTQQPK